MWKKFVDACFRSFFNPENRIWQYNYFVGSQSFLGNSSTWVRAYAHEGTPQRDPKPNFFGERANAEVRDGRRWGEDCLTVKIRWLLEEQEDITTHSSAVSHTL